MARAFSTSFIEANHVSGIAPIIRGRGASEPLNLPSLNQQRLHFEHVVFHLVPQFVGVLVLKGLYVQKCTLKPLIHVVSDSHAPDPHPFGRSVKRERVW